MEEEMMVMIRRTPPLYSTSWTLYDNPSYYSTPPRPHRGTSTTSEAHPTHSARKLAAFLWHLTFIMDSEFDIARAKIRELKAELDHERKQRKKVENVNKKLCKQVLEERKRREAVEDACEKLAREVATEKAEMDRMKKDIIEERRMLRMSEVLREERVQMKLGEAKCLFEEKLSELEFYKCKAAEERKVSNVTSTNESTTMSPSIENTNTNTNTSSSSTSTSNNVSAVTTLMNKRRGSPEAENPHIKRGIKGFVEFPRVVRAISSRGRQLGSKVECQKAQLRLLLRQKSPFRSNNLIMS